MLKWSSNVSWCKVIIWYKNSIINFSCNFVQKHLKNMSSVLCKRIFLRLLVQSWNKSSPNPKSIIVPLNHTCCKKPNKFWGLLESKKQGKHLWGSYLWKEKFGLYHVFWHFNLKLAVTQLPWILLLWFCSLLRKAM
jgi:hypothetical protein